MTHERSFGLTPMFGLRREIDRLFDDTFFGRGTGATWHPAVDIRESSKELRLDIELPGMQEDDIEIEVENGTLTIRGEKSAERKEGEEGRFHLVERTYGSFQRSFQLPQGVDEKQIQAEFDKGVLHISIPKAALPQPRRIQIGGAPAERTRGDEQSSARRDDRGSRRDRTTGKEEGQGERMVAKPGSGDASQR